MKKYKNNLNSCTQIQQNKHNSEQPKTNVNTPKQSTTNGRFLNNLNKVKRQENLKTIQKSNTASNNLSNLKAAQKKTGQPNNSNDPVNPNEFQTTQNNLDNLKTTKITEATWYNLKQLVQF